MEAGSDTTASTLLSYLLGVISNPGALNKAQNEVDKLCGLERSPTFADLGQLLYLRACMNGVNKPDAYKEAPNLIIKMQTLRWRPVAPGGIPHMLAEDDVYDGYAIPKGTIVFTNAWSIHREEDEYDNSDDFIPERFLDNQFGSHHKDNESQDSRRATYSFGAGRRLCPGQRLAESSLVRSSSFACGEQYLWQSCISCSIWRRLLGVSMYPPETRP